MKTLDREEVVAYLRTLPESEYEAILREARLTYPKGDPRNFLEWFDRVGPGRPETWEGAQEELLRDRMEED